MPKSFTFRCPDDLWAAILAKSNGRDNTAVVVEALRAGLSLPGTVSAGVPSGQLSSLTTRLVAVENALTMANDRIEALEDGSVRQGVIQHKTPPKTTRASTKPKASTDPEGWMNFSEAFVMLGGVRGDSSSTVRTTAGRAVKWPSFRQWLTKGVKGASYSAFGLEKHLTEPKLRRLRGPDGRPLTTSSASETIPLFG